MVAISQYKKKAKRKNNNSKSNGNNDILPSNTYINIKNSTKGNKKLTKRKQNCNKNYHIAAIFPPRTRYHSIYKIYKKRFRMGKFENNLISRKLMYAKNLYAK